MSAVLDGKTCSDAKFTGDFRSLYPKTTREARNIRYSLSLWERVGVRVCDGRYSPSTFFDTQEWEQA
jgi:hypothetical protein